MSAVSPKLSVVIPCFNEFSSIPIVIPHLLQCLNSSKILGAEKSFEVIVIDDCSKDESLKALKNIPDITVINNMENLGYGGALKRGFQAARGEFVAFFDLDRTYDPADLEGLLEILIEEKHFIVFGNRMSERNHMPWTRYLGNFFYATLIRVLYSVKIRDVCTGMRIFKRSLISDILKIEESGLNFSIAFTVMFLNKRIAFSQSSIKYHERIGRSKLSIIKDGISFLLTIFKYYRVSSK